jgi:hypothetical protein
MTIHRCPLTLDKEKARISAIAFGINPSLLNSTLDQRNLTHATRRNGLLLEVEAIYIFHRVSGCRLFKLRSNGISIEVTPLPQTDLDLKTPGFGMNYP